MRGYSIPDQLPFAANIRPYECVVKLDNGWFIALDVEVRIEPHTGNPAVLVNARAVESDGRPRLDHTGNPVSSGFSHCSNPEELGRLGGMKILQKLVIDAVLGEPPTKIWNDPIHATVMDHASIRTNIASFGFAGRVNDLSSIL